MYLPVRSWIPSHSKTITRYKLWNSVSLTSFKSFFATCLAGETHFLTDENQNFLTLESLLMVLSVILILIGQVGHRVYAVTEWRTIIHMNLQNVWFVYTLILKKYILEAMSCNMWICAVVGFGLSQLIMWPTPLPSPVLLANLKWRFSIRISWLDFRVATMIISFYILKS